MIKPEKPHDEGARLNALYGLNILDTEPEERFDRLTRMAKRMFNVPIALVSIVDTDRQWFKSCFGLDVNETHRDLSFCGHAILSKEVLVVSNALEDERFADNSLVTGEPHIRFYAGCPIVSPGGYRIGTLCIIDTASREFNAEDQSMLRDFASMVEKELAAHHLDTIDELTGIQNRRGFYLIAEHSLALCSRHKSIATIAVFGLNNFKQIEETYGEVESDKVLAFFAKQVKNSFRESDLVARIGDHDFCALLLNTHEQFAEEVVTRLAAEVNRYQVEFNVDFAVTFSAGISQLEPDHATTVHSVLEDADRKMKEHKQY